MLWHLLLLQQRLRRQWQRLHCLGLRWYWRRCRGQRLHMRLQQRPRWELHRRYLRRRRLRHRQRGRLGHKCGHGGLCGLLLPCRRQGRHYWHWGNGQGVRQKVRRRQWMWLEGKRMLL